MLLAAHYYRPPFPESRFWTRDLARMKAAGLDALQIWVTWAWVEAEPGVYRFDDYEMLFDEAARHGLGVVVSTLGELQPEWIHRLVPEGTMIDHMGNRVISSHRIESNFGLTPGGCTDHPEVARRMAAFLRTTAEHFKHRENLVSWDIWNELRWNIHADGYVCHCPHTLAAFRAWLESRHGDLDGLNRAWHRRYSSWNDVLPGKSPGRPYTETMAFSAFLQHRAEEHLRFRAAIFHDAGVRQPVGAHGQTSSIDQAGKAPVFQTPVCRGSDWAHAQALDSYGVSHFPLWGKPSLTGFMVSVEASGAAAKAGGDKPLWINELQGGAANYGHEIAAPVRAAMQQRWLWSSVACGAKAVIFWSWNDEVFGREATGFGIAGHDGFAGERLAALAKISAVWREHRELLDGYHPDDATVGVWFSPEAYQLEAAETGQADKSQHSIRSWLGVCEQLHQRAMIVTASHLDAVLSGLKLLVLPCANIIAPEAVARLVSWVEAGGTLVCEAETDAWDANGFYRVEPEDRPLLHRLGFAYGGRRPGGLRMVTLHDGRENFEIAADWFSTPLSDAVGKGEVLVSDGNGEVLAMSRKLGAGRVYALGFFAGLGFASLEKADEALVGKRNGFLKWVARLLSVSGASGIADGTPRVLAPDSVHWRVGWSGTRRMVFLVNDDSGREAQVEIVVGDSVQDPSVEIRELLTGHQWQSTSETRIVCTVPPGDVRVVCIIFSTTSVVPTHV